MTGFIIHAQPLCKLSKILRETNFVTTAEWRQRGVSHVCLSCFGCCRRNFATEVSGLSLKQYHINLLSSELRHPTLATRESERRVICQAEASGKLRGLLQFSTRESYIFFPLPRGDNVRPSSSVFYALHFFSMASKDITQTEAVPTTDVLIRQLLFWRGRNARQLFRIWHSACRQLISLLSSGLHHSSLFLSSCSSSINWNFLANFSCSLPIGFEASLHSQLCRQVRINLDECVELAIFYAVIVLRVAVRQKFPYLSLRPALCPQMQHESLFSS